MEKVIAKARKQGIYVKTFDGIVYFKPEELLFGIRKKIIMFKYKDKNYYVEYFKYKFVWALRAEDLSKTK